VLLLLLVLLSAETASVVLLPSLLVVSDDARILYSDRTDTGDAVLLLLVPGVQLLTVGTSAVSLSVQSLLDVHTNSVCCNVCDELIVIGKLLGSDVYVASIHVMDSL
jgi:hypothetical protein